MSRSLIFFRSVLRLRPRRSAARIWLPRVAANAANLPPGFDNPAFRQFFGNRLPDMQTQPQLLLLQKTMVVVEGVARTLNPDLNMWTTAEPVVSGWIKRQLGPAGKLEEAAGSLGQLFTGLPGMLEDARRATTMLLDMAAAGGLRLDQETTEQLAAAQSRHARWTRFWLALGAISLAAIAVKLIS